MVTNMSDAGEFSLTQVISGLRIKRETYKEWIMRGFITASIQKQQGARTFNSYTAHDILAVALFRHLIEKAKLPRDVAAGMVRSMRDSGISLHQDGYIVIKRKDLFGQRGALEVQMYEPKSVNSKQAKPFSERDPICIKIAGDFDTAYVINWRKILKQVRAEFKF